MNKYITHLLAIALGFIFGLAVMGLLSARAGHMYLEILKSQYVWEQDKPHIHLVVSKVIEYDFGWVFCYNAKEYLETNDMELGLTGNAPLIVDRNDGQLYITGTAYPIEHYLDQYRKGVRTRAHV